MQIEIGLAFQILIAVAGIVGSYTTLKMRTHQHAKERKELLERIGSLEERAVLLEKEQTALLSRREAEEHFVSKLEFKLTMKNVDDKLGHIETNQSEILKILRGGR